MFTKSESLVVGTRFVKREGQVLLTEYSIDVLLLDDDDDDDYKLNFLNP